MLNILSFFAFLLGALLLLVFIPKTYRAEIIVAPANRASEARIGLSSGLGSLANIAGFDIASGGSDTSRVALALLSAPTFLDEFARERDVLVPLFAARRWDPATNELSLNNDIYDPQVEQWVRRAAAPKLAAPSPIEVADEFSKRLDISLDVSTGLYRITLDFVSPHLAAAWLNLLILDVNEAVRSRDVDVHRASILYLNEEISRNSRQEIQLALYRLIEEHMKALSVAEVDREYALRVVSPAVEPVTAVRPRPLLFLVGALLVWVWAIGLVLLYGYVYFDHSD